MTTQPTVAVLKEEHFYSIWKNGYSQIQPEWKKWDGPDFEDYQMYESSIMKLATLLYSKKIVSLSLSKSVISFDNRLETVRLSSQG